MEPVRAAQQMMVKFIVLSCTTSKEPKMQFRKMSQESSNVIKPSGLVNTWLNYDHSSDVRKPIVAKKGKDNVSDILKQI